MMGQLLLRAILVNELGWFKSEDEEGDEDE